MEKSGKKKKKNGQADDSAGVEQKVLHFAEQLGWLIETVEAKSEGWLDRHTLITQVGRIRDSAAALVSQLGIGASQGSPGSRGSQGAQRAPTKRAMAADKPSRGPAVDAPGKRHRPRPPSHPGVKHSDLRIAKDLTFRNARRRGPQV